jgi:hypothetical protein
MCALVFVVGTKVSWAGSAGASLCRCSSTERLLFHPRPDTAIATEIAGTPQQRWNDTFMPQL